MNRTKLKNYAPQARRDFIQAVTDRAAYFGLKEIDGKVVVDPVTKKGDSVLIGGKVFTPKVGEKRKRLEDRVRQHGFTQTMEALAYTWFNRLVAIRFMELHDYLENGEGGASYRVLSNPDLDKLTPEILEKAELVTLQMLDKEKVIDLKLDGTKEIELYRLLLIAECNALNSAMPFLFERIDDETELVVPDNLLHSDSLIRKLVNEIDEEDWKEVEIIGWLYQFYISEKKDEVIGKVVASEDIPAATQLFTPNWIVKYLVQNTLGRQWLATYPQSALRQQMAYYIEPAEQTPEVQEQLKAITPTSLNPEEITLLDPACGSAHILVEGYDVFKAIYQERGYRAKDIPRLILQKNLFGLEIDDRAAQLAAFALMMKARADDRHIFTSGVKPNVLAIQESKGLDARNITDALNAPILKEKMPPSQYLLEEMEDEENPLFSRKAMSEKGHVAQADVATLLELFEDAKTFGSLIQVPPKLTEKLPSIEQRLRDVLQHGDLTHATAGVIAPLLLQARFLAQHYDAVVANPPYMGSRHMLPSLKSFMKHEYPDQKADLFAGFIEKGRLLSKKWGRNGLITMHSWMFLSSFQAMRQKLLLNETIESMIHLGPRAFSTISGEIVQTVVFVLLKTHLSQFVPTFFRLVHGEEEEKRDSLLARTNKYANVVQDDFQKIPGTPVAYWTSHRVRGIFETGTPLGEIAYPCQGMASTNNALFLRQWQEVSLAKIGFGIPSEDDASKSGKKWFPYNKGGELRKWFGNNVFVVNYENKGRTICDYIDNTPGVTVGSNGRVINRDRFFKASVTWSFVSSSSLGVRRCDPGFVFDVGGSSAFPTDKWRNVVTGYLCTPLAYEFMKVMNPTMNFQAGNISALPLLMERVSAVEKEINGLVEELVTIARNDWDSVETSWAFHDFPMLASNLKRSTLSESFYAWDKQADDRVTKTKELEKENNRLFIEAYGLQDELSPEVPDDQITLYRPDREEDIKRLLSYAIGCMMGRYSLDKPGLIYANSGNVGFDPSQYKAFPADDDGIVPLLDADWGIRDDAANRIVEFIGVAWQKEHLEENLKFIAESLGPTKNEHSRDTIRRYLATGFYKDHLRWYRRRPIYWLFSSGKQRAFQCLVYLHRYHEGTLARMRTEYVIPLQSKIAARIEQLEADKTKATSTSHGRKLQKEQDDLKKKQTELFAFDEKLKHAADKKISLDLDDGVKVNYAKFGDLLAEVKAVTGGKEEE